MSTADAQALAAAAAPTEDAARRLPERPARASRPTPRGWLVRRMLLAADVVALVAAFAAAEAIAAGPLGIAPADSLEYLVFLLALPAWVVIAKLCGLYDRDEERAGHSTIDDVGGVFKVVTAGMWVFYVTLWATSLGQPAPPKLFAFWSLAVVLVTLARVAARSVCRRSRAYVQKTVVVGGDEVARLVARKVLQYPEYGIDLVGYVDDEPSDDGPAAAGVAYLGPLAELPKLVSSLDADRVIVAFPDGRDADMAELVAAVRRLSVQVDIVPRLHGVIGPAATVHALEGLPLVGLPPARMSRSSRLLKRAVDLVGAALLLLAASPLLLAIAVAVKLSSPGPILFRQLRLGLGMQEFTLLKFRTMRVGTDEAVHREYIRAAMASDDAAASTGLQKLDRGADVTRVGAWLRRTSLDELPQLVNVLRGEMSLVGPRPCIPYETQFFLPHHFERFLVPAGLTGLWQATARARATFSEALDMDVAYAYSRSLALDVSLIMRTARQVIRRAGTL